jgi:hypothetical protein
MKVQTLISSVLCGLMLSGCIVLEIRGQRPPYTHREQCIEEQLGQREKELDKRTKELDKREKELEKRENKLEKSL